MCLVTSVEGPIICEYCLPCVRSGPCWIRGRWRSPRISFRIRRFPIWRPHSVAFEFGAIHYCFPESGLRREGRVHHWSFFGWPFLPTLPLYWCWLHCYCCHLFDRPPFSWYILQTTSNVPVGVVCRQIQTLTDLVGAISWCIYWKKRDVQWNLDWVRPKHRVIICCCPACVALKKCV